MSLDDTPLKAPPASALRRRLASKSMHDLAGAGAFPVSTPSRALSIGSDGSPMSVASAGFGRRSEAGGSPTKRSDKQSNGPDSPSPSLPVHLPAPPPRAGTAPAILSHHATYDEDDVPSPFLKKTDGSRFPSGPPIPGKAATVAGRATAQVPVRSTRASLGSKPTMASKLLAARAQAGASVDEVGRRLSSVGGHLRGKSVVS